MKFKVSPAMTQITEHWEEKDLLCYRANKVHQRHRVNTTNII